MVMRNGKKIAIPTLIIVLMSCLLSLVFYPMMNAKIANIPVAVLSLDEGMKTPQGEVNVGDSLVDKLVETSKETAKGDDPTIIWKQFDSKSALNTAMDEREYYASIVIPKDFTQRQVASQVTAAQSKDGEQTSEDATTSTPTIHVTIDNGKSPLVANLLKQSMNTMLAQTGAQVDLKVIHQGDVTADSGSPTAAMMSQNVLIMPTFIISMIVGLMTCMFVGGKRNDRKTTAERWRNLAAQSGLACANSLLIALAVDCISAIIGSGWLSVTAVMFLWLASLAIMLTVLGLANILFPLGAAIGVLTFGFGAVTGIFPYELLPKFWQNWVYGWVPQRYIGEGVRAITLYGDPWWNSATPTLLILLCIGVACVAVAGFLPRKTQRC